MKLRLLGVVLCLAVCSCQTMKLAPIGNDGTTVDFDNYKLNCPSGADFHDGTPERSMNAPDLNCLDCKTIYCSFSEKQLLQEDKTTIHGPAVIYNEEQRSKGYINNNQIEGVWITESKEFNNDQGDRADIRETNPLNPVRIIEKKTFQGGKPKGTVIRYKNGKPIFSGNLDGDQYVGSVKFMKPDGSVISEGSYNQAKELYDKYVSEEKSKQEQLAAAERKKREKENQQQVNEIEKNWTSTTDNNGNSVYYDKTTKRKWSQSLTMSNWYQAKQACSTLGSNWRLPHYDEFLEAFDNGAAAIFDHQEFTALFWTNVDKATVRDMRLAMALQSYDAFAFYPEGRPGAQVLPTEKASDSVLVRCVK